MKIFNSLLGILAIVISLVFYGCGGGGGSGGGSPSNANLLAVGKNTLVFAITSTAKLQTSVSGINFSITLLPGISVATANGLSGAIVPDSVQPGNGMVGKILIFGSYSIATRKVSLGMATTSGAFRSGEFLRLICNVAPNTKISLGDLQTLNSPVTIYKAVGYDSTAKTTVLLTDSLELLFDLAH